MHHISGMGPAELVMLVGVTGLACGLPLLAALVVAAIALHRRRAPR